MTTNNPDASNTSTTQAEPITETYLCLKSASAPKLGQHATGRIHYQLLTDPERRQLFIRITQNDGAGYFSKELVPFDKVQAAVADLDAEQPFPSKVLKFSFRGASQNNSGFLACAMRAEGLLTSIPDKVHLHRRHGDWAAWASACLEQPGEPMEIAVSGGKTAASAAVTLPVDTAAPMPKKPRKDQRGHKHEAVETGDANHP